LKIEDKIDKIIEALIGFYITTTDDEIIHPFDKLRFLDLLDE